MTHYFTSEAFEEALGRPPRAVQEAVFPSLAHWFEGKEPLVLELPTGSGKSNIGMFAIIQAMRADVAKSAAYVCTTKDLQRQVYAECKEMEEMKPVFMLMGKNNYVCSTALWKYLKYLRNSKKGCITNDGDDYTEAVYNYFSTLLDSGHVHERDDPYWETSEMDTWIRFATTEIGMKECDAECVWKHVGGNNCNCVREAMEDGLNYFEAIDDVCCPTHRAKMLAKESKLLVANAAYVCTMFSVYPGDLAGRLMVFDEVQSFVEHAHVLSKDSVPKELNARTMASTLNTWSTCGVSSLLNVVASEEDMSVFGRLPQKTSTIAFDSPYVDMMKGAIGKTVTKYDAEEFEQARRFVWSMQEDISDCLSFIWDKKITVRERLDMIRGIAYEYAEEMSDETLFNKKKLSKDLHSILFLKRIRLLEVEDELSPILKAVQILHAGQQTQTVYTFSSLLKSTEAAVRTLYYASLSIDKWGWLSSEMKTVCPELSPKGISFIACAEQKAADIYENIWKRLPIPPLLMSATLTYWESRMDAKTFDIFLEMIGLKNSMTFVGESPFPVANKAFEFVIPKTSFQAVMDAKGTEQENEIQKDYNDELFEFTLEYVSNTPRGALVLSPSLNEIESLMNRMREALPSYLHVDARDKRQFRDFVNSGIREKFVLYGSRAMATGVNLPGRLSLVIFTRSFAPNPGCSGQYAIQYIHVENKGKYWNEHWARACWDFIQGSGRAWRTFTDQGIVVYRLKDNSDKYKPADRDAIKVAKEIGCKVDVLDWPVPSVATEDVGSE